MPILGAALLAAAPWHAAAALAGLAVPPAPATLAQAPTRGALLYDTHCSGCHTTQMHWRDRRVVRDWAGLVDQVAQWAARERLGWGAESIHTSFQSVFGREEWLRPYTVQHVARLAESGVKRIAVIAPAFAADCIETLEEIQGEIREAFEHAGGESFTYVPCLNDESAHMDALAAIVAENLRGWLG